MKTIKMIADELNVTKQTIVNNAKNLNIIFEKKNGVNYINEEDYLKIVNKINKRERVFVNNDKKIQEHNKEKNKEFLNESFKTNFVGEEKLKLKVNELEKQIENFKARSEKDSTYIETLTEQLNQQNSNVNTLNRLLENQQILALESNKKIQRLENELENERQLNYSSESHSKNQPNVNTGTIKKTTSDDNKQFISPDLNKENLRNKTEEDDIKTYQNENNYIKKEKKPYKGFWSRLFGG